MNYYEQIERVEILLEQDRFQEAEELLDTFQGSYPDSAHIKYLYARCRYRRNDPHSALRLINEAIGLNPNDPYFFCEKSMIHHHLGSSSEAFENISEAIRLAPNIAVFRGLRAGLLYGDNRFREALSDADEGLRCEPEDPICMNIRSLSQIKLNMSDEAADMIRNTLKTHPNDAMSHATTGMLFLQKGNSKEALEWFRESLRIDPTGKFAKLGLLEALKSRFFLYRWFYLFFEWMSRQSGKVQWGVILAIFGLQQILRAVVRSNPDAKSYLMPVIWVLCAFIYLTWVMEPLSNLFLRLNRYGRYTLSKDKIDNSTWTGTLLALGVILLFGLWITGNQFFLFAAIHAMFGVIPVRCIYSFKGGKFSVRVRVLSLLLIALMVLTTVFPMLIIVEVTAFVGFQFYMNYLSSKS